MPTRAATTRLGESQRTTEDYQQAQRRQHEILRQTFGTIKEVSGDGAAVKVLADNGTDLCAGNWVLLNHGVQEIIERWGQVRVGFRVLVTYSGPMGNNANAFIVGLEGETTGNQNLLPNDAAQGFHRCMAPGSGV